MNSSQTEAPRISSAPSRVQEVAVPRSVDPLTALQRMSALVSYWNRDLCNVFSTDGYADWAGLEPHQLRGRHVKDVMGDARHRQHLPAMQAALRGVRHQSECVVQDADGTPLRTELIECLPDVVDGEVLGFFMQLTDVTARVQMQNEHALFKRCINEANDVIVITEAEPLTEPGPRMTFVNDAYERTTGYTREEALGNTPRMLQGPKTDPAAIRRIGQALRQWKPVREEILNYAKDGREFWSELDIVPVANASGRYTHWIAIQRDVTERKVAEERIQNLAFFDPLTNLPNRRLLMDRLRQALIVSARRRRLAAIMLLDLDGFKGLNDTHGHGMGDLLLQQVAARLKSSVREGDTVARLGGDEFVVILEDLDEEAPVAAAQAATVTEKILAYLREPYALGNVAYSCTPSIGLALAGDRTESAEAPLSHADLAMYQAKQNGGNGFCFFDPRMQSELSDRYAMARDLREALAKKQFSLQYQAQVDGENAIIGVEALLRWHHPERGWVSPAAFIPKAEKIGLIVPLGLWVIETACSQLVAWSNSPRTSGLTISVNVSLRQFSEADFVEQVLAIVERTGIDPALLKLEVTESLLAANVEEVIAKMSALVARGIGFSMDDFGTGYSSLAYLKRLPLEVLKVDQSFVRDILTDRDDEAIAKLIISLGAGLGLTVMAEGVETQQQIDLLAELGCQHYQGYFFSRPLPVSDFEAHLARMV